MARQKKVEVAVEPLFNKDGSIAVDPARCPTLHRALARSRNPERRGEWERVSEFRRKGEVDAADRLVRKLLGIQGPPMTEETKEELRAYNEAHKDEIKARAKQRREVRRRTMALLKTGGKGRR